MALVQESLKTASLAGSKILPIVFSSLHARFDLYLLEWLKDQLKASLIYLIFAQSPK
jgi:hypothetical protein